MAPRERRNLVSEPELMTETEFLVFGSFREDPADEGYKATVWLPTSDLTPLHNAFDDALDGLESLLRGTHDSIEWEAFEAAPAPVEEGSE